MTPQRHQGKKVQCVWGAETGLPGGVVCAGTRKSVGRSEDMLNLLVNLFTHSSIHPFPLSVHSSVCPPTHPPTIYPSILLSTDSGLALS